MSDQPPTKTIKAPTKRRPEASLLAAILLALQKHLDPQTLSTILETATQHMHDFRAFAAKRSPNE